MNKGDYLSELHKYLANMPTDERDSAMRFYMEYFDDAGAENEQAVMEQLGTPRQLSEQLLGESVPQRTVDVVNAVNKMRARKMTPWSWALVVLASPLLIPLGATALGLAVAALAVVFSALLVVTIMVMIPPLVSAMLMLGGAFMMISGIGVVFQHFPTALVMVGSGIAIGACGALLMQPSLRLMRKLSRKLFQFTGWITGWLRRPRFAMKGGK